MRIAGAQQRVTLDADVPALVVWGARDPYVPVSLAPRQRQAFPAARIEILPGVGHWPLAEAPERTERLVTSFLENRVSLPHLVAKPLRARAGERKLSLHLSVAGATSTPQVRVRLTRGGRLIGATGARAVDRVPRRVAIALRGPLRRGRYTLALPSAQLPTQTQAVRVR